MPGIIFSEVANKRGGALGRMRYYYFDLRYDDGPWSDDEDGVPFPDTEQARAAALSLATAITKEEARSHRKIQVRLRDHNSRPITTVTLSVTIEPPA